MWLFTNKAFLSIVVPYPDDIPERYRKFDVLAVRARRKADLLAMFGRDAVVFESPDRDYRWRCYINRERLASMAYDHIQKIGYHNFKDSIPAKDKDRKSAYMGVWGVMDRFQETATPRPRRRAAAPLFDYDND